MNDYKTLGKKIASCRNGEAIAFLCPGCDRIHTIDLTVPGSVRWTFNGNPHKPTITPSWRAQWTYSDGKCPTKICQWTLTDGWLQFHDDCTHRLSGQRVELPDWPKVRRY